MFIFEILYNVGVGVGMWITWVALLKLSEYLDELMR